LALAIPIALLFATIYLVPAFRALNEVQTFGDPDSSKLDPRIEQFEDAAGVQDPVKPYGDAAPYTLPTARNPFMNVLVDEIKYNPMRAPAAPINDPQVAGSLDDVFRVQFTSDPTDVFGKTQSQRQFIAMPSTTVPNDQGSFADWLYRIPGKTCKEGGRDSCLPGSDGAVLPWLNQGR
jgi:hypothetical protein